MTRQGMGINKIIRCLFIFILDKNVNLCNFLRVLIGSIPATFNKEVPVGSMSQVNGLPHNSYKSITNTAWVRARLYKSQKGCTRLAAASDTIYQLLVHGMGFSPGTPASSTTNTSRHDIAEILLKVALNTNIQIQFQILLIEFYVCLL